MEKAVILVVGLIFVGGGAKLARDGWEDQKNTIETVAFGGLGVVFGVLLILVAIFGTPDWL